MNPILVLLLMRKTDIDILDMNKNKRFICDRSVALETKTATNIW